MVYKETVKSWKDFILGAATLGVVLLVGGWCFIRFGFAPVAVSAPPFPFEKYLANTARHAVTDKAADVRSPVEPTEENLMAGARTYREACAVCHSLPGAGKTKFEKGMYPPPPELFEGTGVTDDPVGVTHWVVQNGIRLTGMPSFEGAYSDQQLWQVSLLLARAHMLPQSLQDFLKQELPK